MGYNYLIIRNENFQNPFRPFFHAKKGASILRMTIDQKQKILKPYGNKFLETRKLSETYKYLFQKQKSIK